MGFDSPSHWAIVAVVVLVLFGYKKLPEMSRSVGRSLRIFKTEMKGLSEDDTARDADATPVATSTVAPTPPPAATAPVAAVPPVAVPVAPAPVAQTNETPAPVYPTVNAQPAQPPAASQQLGA